MLFYDKINDATEKRKDIFEFMCSFAIPIAVAYIIGFREGRKEHVIKLKGNFIIPNDNKK